MEYVEIEVRAKSVDLAVEAAMQELGVNDPDEVDVQVITEPVKGFLGMGGQDAVVRVKRRPAKRQRRGRGRNRDEKSSRSSAKNSQNRQQDRAKNGKNGGKRPEKQPSKGKSGGKHTRTESKVSDDRPTLSLEEQADVAREFLEGLVEAYGLEGSVSTNIDDEVIVVDVEGNQTEAMVGVRGSVRSAVHELTRTVLQRYSKETARLRLDIAGYAERRRKALSIYAEQLIDQLMEEGGEIMLEPMSPADRKVIHDAAGDHDGITSYSEGEPPKRYVVLSRSGDTSEEE
ncbi:MAG TPA: RNA-binding cell elongation regulator Jag/EloR [Acidimicrobiia bacterium]|nr:RNA-binding cell elongation regulator Jag/EloR [Acidimicrobiia bacterium]